MTLRLMRLGLILSLALLLGACGLLPDAPSRRPTLEPGAAPALLRVVTCWAAQPLAQSLTEAWAVRNGGTAFDITVTSSAAALELLRGGQADLALVADSGDDVEGLTAQPLAYDGLAVVVNAGAPVTALDTATLRSLYAGYVLDWSTLESAPAAAPEAGGGVPEPVTRPADDPAQALFTRAVMGEETITSAALLAPNDQAVYDAVRTHPAAIGYLSRAYLGDGVRAIALDGVTPSDDALRDGTYPLRYTLVALGDREGATPGAGLAQSWLQFASTTAARRLVSGSYVPVP